MSKKPKFQLESVWIPRKALRAVAVDVLNWDLMLALIEGLPRQGFTVYLPQSNPEALEEVPLAYIIDDWMKEYLPLRATAEKITKWFEFHTAVILIAFYTPREAAYSFADDVITAPFEFDELIKLLKRRQIREIAITRNVRYGYGYWIENTDVFLDPRIEDAIVNGQFIGLTPRQFQALLYVLSSKTYWTYESVAVKFGFQPKQAQRVLSKAFNLLPQLKPYVYSVTRENVKYFLFTGNLVPVTFEEIDKLLQW